MLLLIKNPLTAEYRYVNLLRQTLVYLSIHDFGIAQMFDIQRRHTCSDICSDIWLCCMSYFFKLSGDLYDVRSLSLDLLFVCVSMLSLLTLFMVCISFCLKWLFFRFIIVSCCRFYIVSSFSIWMFHGFFGLVAMSFVWHVLSLWILW